MKLKVGDEAPDFILPDQSGENHQLSTYRGRWVLVYFYPKDDTPGCTKEACAIRDNWPEFRKLDVMVLGISMDSAKRHRQFSEKYRLPFVLLADPDRTAIKPYGAWGEKNFMGRKYFGILRTSFLIDPAGVIRKIYEQVKPEAHAEAVLHDLLKLRQ